MHLLFIITMKDYHNPHFTDEKTEAEHQLGHMPEGIGLVSGIARIWLQKLDFQGTPRLYCLGRMS